MLFGSWFAIVKVLADAPTVPRVFASTAALMKPRTRETIVPLASRALARPMPLPGDGAGSAASSLLTPHPAEAARLLGSTVATVQEDRVRAARMLCENLNAHTVLKGNGSIVVARDGHWFINTSGNPGMASAGMGDVFAGMLGALLAQRYSGETALTLGVHLHGVAADTLVQQGNGPVGLTAGELIDTSRRIWNSWLNA